MIAVRFLLYLASIALAFNAALFGALLYRSNRDPTPDLLVAVGSLVGAVLLWELLRYLRRR